MTNDDEVRIIFQDSFAGHTVDIAFGSHHHDSNTEDTDKLQEESIGIIGTFNATELLEGN